MQSTILIAVVVAVLVFLGVTLVSGGGAPVAAVLAGGAVYLVGRRGRRPS